MQSPTARDARVLHCGTTCVLLYYVNAEPHGQRRKGSALRHYLRTLRVQCLPVPVNAEPHGQRRKGSALRRLLRTLRVLETQQVLRWLHYAHSVVCLHNVQP